jgi:hypothetical protein
MSFVVDLSPGYGDAKGFIEVFTGQDLVTEEELGNWRWLGLLGLSEVRRLKHLDEVGNACYDLAKLKLIGKAFETAETARLLERSGTAVNRTGQPLPRMVQMASGKYDPRDWGIDRFAKDEHGKLWIIEFKGGRKEPKLGKASYGYQMSTSWIQRNVEHALDDEAILVELEAMTGLKGEELESALKKANLAVIVPEGAKLKRVSKTSLNRNTDIYYLKDTP